MSQKVRKTLIMIVMAALIICLMAASLTYTFTYGRYAGGKFDEESPYDDLIEFVGAREYTVRSPEELIQAIEDGYSNIKIADDAEEPFVITEGVTDVTANLVLNLNGKVVIRNSRNPMLDVQTNVSVVLVYDSTNKGAFYNPVGSSLMASGGSLTVGSGGYESGPRAEEYENKTAAGTLSKQPSDVAIYTRGGITSPSAVNRTEQLSYSKITPSEITPSGNLVPATTGRYYQPETSSSTIPTYAFVPADTFLLYTIEKDCFVGDDTSSGGVTFESDKLYVDAESETVGNDTIITASEFTTPLCNVASCDFYYYYPTGGTAGTKEAPQDYAVIYGYWDVKALARDDKENETDAEGMATALMDRGLVYPFAAVRMVEGEGIVRGGTFSNHFDAVNTYGIYAEGGTLSVSKNTTVDTTFTTGGEGVCIRVQSATGETTTTGGSLTISGGEFSSEIGNTIEMSGGKMTVTKGTFTKTGCKEGTEDKQLQNQTAIISLLGGTLNVSGAKTGDDTYSVTMTAGAENSTLENVFGIRADGGGTVTTKGVSFHIYGNYSAGVLSYNGTVNLDDNTDIKVTQSNEFTDTNNNNNNILLTSAGVSSEGGTINLTGNVTIESNGLGITARGTVNVTGGTTSTVTTSRGTGIYVNNGSFTVGSEAAITVKSTVQSGCSWATPPGNTATNTPNIYNGVYVQGGSLESEGTLNVNFTGVENDQNQTVNEAALTGTNAYRLFEIKSYAVRVDGTTAQGVSIVSGTITNKVGGGVLVNGGTVTLGTTGEGAYNESTKRGLTVQTTGKDVYYTLNGQYIDSGIYDAMNGANDADDENIQSGGNWRYLLPKTGGPAVKVTNGDLSVHGGSYHALQGDGIVINGGTAEIQSGKFLGQDSYYIQNHYREGNGNWLGASVQTEGISEPQAGPAASYAFKVYNGKANVYGGTFGSSSSIASGAFVMGTENSMGIAKIYGGKFEVSSGNSGGQAGFSVYEYGNVVVNPGKGGEQQNLGGDVTMTGLAAGLVIESTPNAASVEIKGGKFSSTRNHGNSDGIWYSNSNATLTISGGTFTGYARSGLYFEANPGNNAQLSGGEYRGNGSAWGGKELGSIQTRDLLVTNNDNGTQTFGWLYDLSGNAIIYAHRTTVFGDYNNDRSHVGGTQRSVALNGDLIVTGLGYSESYSPLSDYHYIKVQKNKVESSNNLPEYDVRDYGKDWATRTSP